MWQIYSSVFTLFYICLAQIFHSVNITILDTTQHTQLQILHNFSERSQCCQILLIVSSSNLFKNCQYAHRPTEFNHHCTASDSRAVHTSAQSYTKQKNYSYYRFAGKHFCIITYHLKATLITIHFAKSNTQACTHIQGVQNY